MMQSYSYQGQDRFVLEALGYPHGGFFLDSGASNGVRGSNTRLLETVYGWSGICIEPNDEMFAQLARNRRCLAVHACLFDHDGEVDFLEAGGVYGGILSTYAPDHLAFTHQVIRQNGGGDEALAPVRKRAITAEALLDRVGAPPVIDYWSLDTEGSELRILESFPFDRYRVRALTVEHNCQPVREDLHRLLDARGFVWARDLGIDDGYVHRDALPVPGWRSRVWSR